MLTNLNMNEFPQAMAYLVVHSLAFLLYILRSAGHRDSDYQTANKSRATHWIW